MAVDLAALEAAISRSWELARAAGLDPLPTHFELVPAGVLYEVAAYGLPGRFSHWTHGKAYHRMKAQYDLGLSKYFELVIHADPAQAFLLESNDLLTDRFVVAHVLGHTDFFKHNAHCAACDRAVAARVDLHAQRLAAYAFRYGQEAVERLLDALLGIEEHVDPVAAGSGVTWPDPRASRARSTAPQPPGQDRFADLLPAVPTGVAPKASRVPPPCGDLLLFLQRQAPDLEDWQRDVVAMLREESLYFRPLARTKIANEGWATLWHTRLLREAGLDDAEYTEFARLNAAVRAPQPGGINPYLLGAAIYEDTIERLGEAEGLRQCFLMRELLDDAGLLRNHFTPEVAQRLDLFVYGRRDEGSQPVWKVTAKDFESVRAALIASRENGGHPILEAATTTGAGELILTHRHDGRDLDLADAQKTLERVAFVWGRPCRLVTMRNGVAQELVAQPA